MRVLLLVIALLGPIQQLDAAGFQLVGVRVTLARSAAAGRGDVGGHVRQAAVRDIPALRDIALSAHRDTRFHADFLL